MNAARITPVSEVTLIPTEVRLLSNVKETETIHSDVANAREAKTKKEEERLRHNGIQKKSKIKQRNVLVQQYLQQMTTQEMAEELWIGSRANSKKEKEASLLDGISADNERQTRKRKMNR